MTNEKIFESLKNCLDGYASRQNYLWEVDNENSTLKLKSEKFFFSFEIYRYQIYTNVCSNENDKIESNIFNLLNYIDRSTRFEMIFYKNEVNIKAKIFNQINYIKGILEEHNEKIQQFFNSNTELKFKELNSFVVNSNPDLFN